MSEPEFEETWESLDSHVVPDWFHDAKLGIFIHWGLYSVPAWAPVGELAEWYPRHMHEEEFGHHDDEEETPEYHRETYGEAFDYRDFAEDWHAENWDPNRWAEFFEDVGAGYVVLTAEHHDGFPLYDSDLTDWNAAQKGPQRDLVADLSTAVRDRGLRFAGSYHGLLNYYDPRYPGELFGHPHYGPDGPEPEYVEEMHAKVEEILAHHEPDLLWLDGDWMADAETFRSRELLAEYYNRAASEWDRPVAANDRLGEVRTEHGDFSTPEYETYDEIQERKWETCRGIGTSFGYNRSEEPDDHLSVEELVRSFVDVVSKNGNLLINVGPRADGTIPEVQKERLAGLGDWLDTNGDAIFGTTYWTRAENDPDRGEAADRRYTWKDGSLYAVLFEWADELTVALGEGDAEGVSVSLLTDDGREPLDVDREGDAITVSLPEESADAPAWAIELGGVPGRDGVDASSEAREE